MQKSHFLEVSDKSFVHVTHYAIDWLLVLSWLLTSVIAVLVVDDHYYCFRHIMTGSYNNFFRMFDRESKRDITLEASRDNMKPKQVLKARKVCTAGKRKKDEISVDCLDFSKKILHTAWHPVENVIAVAATNNLYLFQSKD